MGTGGDHHHLNFHLHMPHIRKHHHNNNMIPKGSVAITVGRQGDAVQRFVIPVIYVNHPLFTHLLKEAEDEYGFDQKGTINIPCQVDQFSHIQRIIDQETTTTSHHHHHHHHHHHFLCFKA